MGSDNLFHKRKKRTAKSLSRKIARRSPYNKVLIVCEGEKTEPNYFRELVKYYKINTANVAIDGSCNSSPKSVFERSEELWNQENRKGDPFDRVYCVFDKDSHETYEETLRRISQKGVSNGNFFAVTSVPCFEYWLILHFQYTTQPYSARGKSSIGNEVLKKLLRKSPL